MLLVVAVIVVQVGFVTNQGTIEQGTLKLVNTSTVAYLLLCSMLVIWHAVIMNLRQGEQCLD